MPETSAVVLGGGGLSAIGWSTGVLAAMVRKSRRNAEVSPVADLGAVFPRVMEIHDADADLGAKAEKFFALSRALSGVAPRDRRDAVTQRLHSDAWTDARLTITAVGVDGKTSSFTRNSNVPIADALTASCAVPGLWPVAVIGTDEYIDGGTFSMTNVELAADVDRVLVLRPMSDLPQYDSSVRAQVLDRDTVLEPSDRARDVFGSNPFDPDVRGVAAVCGYEDGLSSAETVRDLFGE